MHAQAKARAIRTLWFATLAVSAAVATTALAHPADDKLPSPQADDQTDAAATPPPSTALPTVREAEAERVTRVRQKRAKRVSRATTFDAANVGIDQLEEAPGVSLHRSGGPLAPATVAFRGLSGNRLSSTVGTLQLNSPATGSLDANRLPFFAIERLTPSAFGSRGATLQFSLPAPVASVVKGRVGGGSFQTMRADVAVGAPLWDAADAPGAVFAAASLASTRGDFSFDVLNGIGLVVDREITRRNNDQVRASALGSLRSQKFSAGPLQFDLATTLLATTHRGGLPGFSSAAPLILYRAVDDNLGIAAKLRGEGAGVRASVDVQTRTNRRTVEAAGQERPSVIHSTGGDVRLSLGTDTVAEFFAPFPIDLDGDIWLRGEGVTLLVPSEFSRAGIGGGGRLQATALDDRVQANASVDVAWLTDTTLTAAADAAIAVSLPLGFAMGIQGGFHRRAPTLDELYAPRGFVVGNPELAPETIADAEGFASFLGGRTVKVRVGIFGGRVLDAIVYVSRNAFEVGPVNTGGAWRAGAEGRLEVTPHRLFAMDIAAQGLWSSLDDTQAPLPLAPPFAGHAHVRIGERFGAALHGTVRHRQGATNTLFGTAATRPYTFFDVRARLPVGSHLAMNLSVANLLNLRTAQDSTLLPLPGRTLFFSVEVNG